MRAWFLGRRFACHTPEWEISKGVRRDYLSFYEHVRPSRPGIAEGIDSQVSLVARIATVRHTMVITMKSIFAVCLLLFPLVVFARFGETKAQCIERYGNPTSVDDGTGYLFFRKSGFEILVHFSEDKVDSITYWKEQAEGTFLRPPLSEIEIAELLKINGGGSEWMLGATTGVPGRLWFNSAKHLVAVDGEGNSALQIRADDSEERAKKRRETEAKERMQGL